MPTRADRRGGCIRVLTLLLFAAAAVAAGCGSDDSPVISGQPGTTSTTANAGPTSPSSSPIPTTPFSFPTTTSVPFVAGEGTLTISGDVQASARFSSTSCGTLSVTEARGVVAGLAYVSDPGTASAKTYVLDLAGLSPGRTTFPEPGGFNQLPPRRVRLSSGGPLEWGTNAAGEGSVSGTLSAAIANAKSGSFDLQLGYIGTGPALGPVSITGSWTCP
jgi:hypothetical protein